MRLETKYFEDAEGLADFVNDEGIAKENIVGINTSNDTEEGIYKNKVVLYYFV